MGKILADFQMSRWGLIMKEVMMKKLVERFFDVMRDLWKSGVIFWIIVVV